MVFIPTSHGLVVAADSRKSFPKNNFCDDAIKILQLDSLPGAVATVTGNGLFVEMPDPSVRNLCHYYRTAKVRLDVELIVKSYLNTLKVAPSGQEMNILKARCLTATRLFLKKYPENVQLYRDAMYQVIVGTFDPYSGTTMIYKFSVRTEPKEGASVIRERTFRIEFSDKPIPRYFGIGEYVNKYVEHGVGREFLKDCYFVVFNTSHVADLSPEQGRCAAESVVDSTKETASIVSPPFRVGGPTRSVLIQGKFN